MNNYYAVVTLTYFDIVTDTEKVHNMIFTEVSSYYDAVNRVHQYYKDEDIVDIKITLCYEGPVFLSEAVIYDLMHNKYDPFEEGDNEN